MCSAGSRPSRKTSPNFIYEAETSCSLRMDHTVKQLLAFAAEAKRVSAEFILLLPKPAPKDAREVLTQLGVRNARIMSLPDG
ncbi:hypothetical protein Desaf_2552 [Desulfocurvibacter africanus subsp. africanus str. Walvis Bay]|uniref:Uncharacterized protein n=2 Tax=Desulfocurvibacter africanus TaxID=873 RepID=F3YZR9_DESAF|nr:hypothetical protein Desaf_2552 [Desulfocurvibacter africanus subsp. africanus str. Walvis Bay]